MPFPKSFLPRAPAWLALGACMALHAADCHLVSMPNSKRARFQYVPHYLPLNKDYTLGTPFKVKAGDQLVYSKVGREQLYLVADTDITYVSGHKYGPTFHLPAGEPYPAESSLDGLPLHAIRLQSHAGATQWLFVNLDGELCEGVHTLWPSSRANDFGSLIDGYNSVPAEGRLQLRTQVDEGFTHAESVTFDLPSPDVLRLTLKVFEDNRLLSTSTQDFDRKTADDLRLQGWRLAMRKVTSSTYEATVVAEPY